MEDISNTRCVGESKIEEIKKRKLELDNEYNAILKIINSVPSREVIEECQSKLVILFEKYQAIAEELKNA